MIHLHGRWEYVGNTPLYRGKIAELRSLSRADWQKYDWIRQDLNYVMAQFEGMIDSTWVLCDFRDFRRASNKPII